MTYLIIIIFTIHVLVGIICSYKTYKASKAVNKLQIEVLNNIEVSLLDIENVLKRLLKDLDKPS
jgi:hypothetical protein